MPETRTEFYNEIPEYKARVDHHGGNAPVEDIDRRGLGAAGTPGVFEVPPVEVQFWENSFPDTIDVVPA